MAAKTNLTTAAQITVNAREVDFVTRFGKNWDALRTIMGIMRPIRKAPGTKLVSYEATVDGTLAGGTSVAEGEEIPLTKMKVTPKTYGDIEIAKYAKSVSVEAVAKYGAEVAVEKTDEAFLVALQNKVLGDFYTFLNTGSLAVAATTWQQGLALAKGNVLDKFASMDRDVTEVVGFANMDKRTKPDGEGGYATEWSEGAEFANYVALDSSLEARQAEAQGVTSVYTGIVRKDVPIEYGSVYKDVTTGTYFRVTSRPEEKQAPASASPMLNGLKSFTAERLWGGLPT